MRNPTPAMYSENVTIHEFNNMLARAKIKNKKKISKAIKTVKSNPELDKEINRLIEELYARVI